MNIVVSANGTDLSAEASPVFGRCPVYIFVDTETMVSEAVENPAVGASSGAGIQAAQFVVERGAQAVVSGNVGPNAFDVLQAASVRVYLFDGGTVQEAVEAFEAGQLAGAGSPSAPAHAGLGMGRGRGRGRGMGRRAAAPASAPAPPGIPSAEKETSELQTLVSDLRSQLAEVMDRLDRIEKEG